MIREFQFLQMMKGSRTEHKWCTRKVHFYH